MLRALPPIIGFIYFDSSTATHLQERTALHRKSNSVQHEPCGLLGDSQSAVNLVRTDSVLRANNHPYAWKPFSQRDRAIFKDGADLDRELFPASFALPDFASAQERNVIVSAPYAFDFIVPPKRSKVQDASHLV
jgi:hypothetical protein